MVVGVLNTSHFPLDPFTKFVQQYFVSVGTSPTAAQYNRGLSLGFQHRRSMLPSAPVLIPSTVPEQHGKPTAHGSVFTGAHWGGALHVFTDPLALTEGRLVDLQQFSVAAPLVPS